MKISPAIIFLTLGSFLSIVGVILSFIESSTRDNTILEIAMENAQLSKQNFELISGGNTFAYLSNHYWSNDGIRGPTIKLVINIDGKLPIYDLRISLYEMNFNFEKSERDLELEKNDPNREITHFSELLLYEKSIGTLSKGITREEFVKIRLKNIPKNHYVVKLRARNGEVTQNIIFRRREDNRWDFATKVEKYVYKSSNSFTVKTIFEKVDKNFPSEDLKWFP